MAKDTNSEKYVWSGPNDNPTANTTSVNPTIEPESKDDTTKSTIVPEAMPSGKFMTIGPGASLESIAMSAYGDKIHGDVQDKRPDEQLFKNVSSVDAVSRVAEYGRAVEDKAREYADRLFGVNLAHGFMRQRNVTTVGQAVLVPDDLPELPKYESR